MNARLQFTTRTDAEGRALVAVGEIDMSNAPELQAAISAALTDVPDSALLTVDLSAVEYLDSSGLYVLFTHARRISIIANQFLEPLFTITGLARIAPLRIA